jgi:ribonuclease R
MNQAVYQPDNKGHFGLAYEAYAHFTSPIRRYPDLLVHRAIKQLIRSRRQSALVSRVKGAGVLLKASIFPYSVDDVVALGLHCSMTERRADDATRDVTAWLKCEYLETRLGANFNGIITAVTGFGFFVELENLYAEGLVHVSTLGQDYFHYDQASQALVGERTHRAFRLGDTVRVVIAAVDLDQRRVDLELEGAPKPRVSAQDKNQSANKGRQSKKGRLKKANNNKKGGQDNVGNTAKKNAKPKQKPRKKRK